MSCARNYRRRILLIRIWQRSRLVGTWCRDVRNVMWHFTVWFEYDTRNKPTIYEDFILRN